MRAKDDAIVRARERVMEDFLGKVRAHGAPLPDGPTVALFAECIDVLLRREPENDVAARFESGLGDVALAERMQRTFDESLQTPLEAIALATSVLEEHVGGRQAQCVLSIARAGAQLNRMLQDVRDFCLCSAALGGLRVSRRPVDLRVLCHRLIEDLQSSHPATSIELLGASELTGQWDPDGIANLITKLLANAIEHGRPLGSAIEMTLRSSDGRAVVDVWNAGPPLGRVSLDRIFEPFFRGAAAAAERGDGLGLGLYLARAIARAHGGTLDAQSGPNEGTTFRLTLPRT